MLGISVTAARQECPSFICRDRSSMSSAHRIVVLGSRNRHKLGELAELLAGLPLTLRLISEYPSVADVVEDGETFLANATKKARETALAVGEWALAEDSGLCVDALGGAPGVYSARFAGQHGDDAANNRLLLEKLTGVSDERRTAHYVCCAVLCDASGEILATATGQCRGRILTSYRGQHGFGYDPLFLIPEYHKTFGELDPAVKRHISHRARALERLLRQLPQLLH